MNKQHRAKNFLMIAVAATALLGSAASYAAPGGKVHICHFPPGNPGNVQALTISESALQTHEDHHDDYIVESPLDCIANPDPPGSSTFLAQICINGSGKQEGRKVRSSLTGLVSSNRIDTCGTSPSFGN